MALTLKTCSRCKEPKTLDLFYSNKAQKDGVHNQCKTCTKLSANEQQLRVLQKRAEVEIPLLAGEIFVPVVVKNIEFEYLISNKGRLVSLKYGIKFIMSPTQEPGRCGRPGYLATALRYPSRKKSLTIRIHVLVGLAFVPNPNNFKQINHKDGDKTNNNDWNIEWCSAKHNIRHSFDTGLNIPKKGKESHMYDKGRKVSLNGIVYNSVADCSRNCGVPRTSLCSELDGRMKTKIGIAYVD